MCHDAVDFDDVLNFDNEGNSQTIGSSERECNSRLTQVLRRIQDAGLTLNPFKRVFKQRSVEYLGYHINAEGIHTGEYMSALFEFLTPTSV